MRKMKNRLSILIAVLVMVSMTGTSVLAYDDVQPAEDPAGTVVNEQEEGVIDETEEPDVLDEEIQKAAGRPIPEIFAAEGEGSFRKLETRVLQEYSKQSGLIIATGGGIVTTPANHDLLKQNSRIIFLKRDLERLPTEGRPLSQSNRLEDLLAQRLPLYESWSDRAIENDTDPKETLHQILSVI